MIRRVVCDTNVLVSALVADGPPSRVVEEAIDGRLELVLPQTVLHELERVLREKLGFTRAHADDARAFFEGLAMATPGPPARIDAVTGDPADDAVLACAVEVGAGVLVTGDRKHLLPIGEHRGTRVCTPQALLAELRA